MSKTASQYAKERRERVRQEIARMPKIACACGCGELIAPMTVNGASVQYKHGHSMKNRHYPEGHIAHNLIGEKPMSREEIMQRFYEKRQAEINAMQKIACACGCGTMIAPIGMDGKPRKFVKGHGSRGKKRSDTPWNKLGDESLKRTEITRRYRERRLQEIAQMSLIPCACGCGTMIAPINKALQPAKYVQGHNPDGEKTRFVKGHHGGIPFEAGEKHRQWRGGVSRFPYGIEFSPQLKKAIRERDNYTCQRCGITQKEYGKTLEVHHMDHDKMNNDPGNLITSCHPCNIWASLHRDEPFVTIRK